MSTLNQNSTFEEMLNVINSLPVNPRPGATGNAQPSDVRLNRTFSNIDDVDLVGTLDLSLLVPENLKEGIVVDGVVGTFKAHATGTTWVGAYGTVGVTLGWSPNVICFEGRSSGLATDYGVGYIEPIGGVFRQHNVNNQGQISSITATGFTIYNGAGVGRNYTWVAHRK